MAVTVKADTEDFPSILRMFGLSGGTPQEETDSPPPSPDAFVRASQGDSDAISPSGSEVIPVTSQPSKLQLLQHTLAGGSHDDAASAVQGKPSPDALAAAAQGDTSAFTGTDQQPNLDLGTGQVLPADLAAQPNIKPKLGTFAGEHPTLAKILNLAVTLGSGAAAGAGSRTFGEGFQKAQELPLQIAASKLGVAEKKAQIAHTQAATDQMKTQVTLPNGLTVPFALAQKLYPTIFTEQGKNARNAANIDSREGIAADKNALALRKQGLKPNPDNPNGQPVPVGRDEMSDTEQAALDLKQAQQDAATAKAELDRSKNDPTSPAYKAAMGRLAVAQRNADTAAGRLGIENKKYLADYFGTDAEGNALPGAQIDEATGKPVGPRMANAGKVPADRLKRGDLAANAIHNLDSVAELVKQNPGLFGKVGGRITNIQEALGSDNPAIRRIAVATKNYAMASVGVHGTRSKGAMEDAANELLNKWKDGDGAILGGIAEAKRSLNEFVEDQRLGNKPRPSEMAAAAPTRVAKVNSTATHVYDPRTGKIVPVAK
jgi:hypothetical protein